MESIAASTLPTAAQGRGLPPRAQLPPGRRDLLSAWRVHLFSKHERGVCVWKKTSACEKRKSSIVKNDRNGYSLVENIILSERSTVMPIRCVARSVTFEPILRASVPRNTTPRKNTLVDGSTHMQTTSLSRCSVLFRSVPNSPARFSTSPREPTPR